MRTTRREFLRLSGAGLTALMLPPGFTRSARAAELCSDGVLVVLFQRGGCDGLSLVPPAAPPPTTPPPDPPEVIGDPFYTYLRPNIAIKDGLRLDQHWRDPLQPPLFFDAAGIPVPDGAFSMHPQLVHMKDLYDEKRLAVIHATGRTGSYSHFDAQDRMERADPTGTNTEGWLHRALWAPGEEGEVADPATLTGVALDAKGIQSLRGYESGRTFSLEKLDGFALTGVERQAVLTQIYGSVATGSSARKTAQDFLGGNGGGLFSALGSLEGLADEELDQGILDLYNAVTAVGPEFGVFRRRLMDAARLIKANLGVRVICLDLDGWDHHDRLRDRMKDMVQALDRGLHAFYSDLQFEGAASNTVILAMTEFGRTAWENGELTGTDQGTDHGWGSAMFAIGEPVLGRRVLCRKTEDNPVLDEVGWPGLGPTQLHGSGSLPTKCDPNGLYTGGRDLEVTIDFRDVFAAVLEGHLGISAASVMPEHTAKSLPDGGLFTSSCT